MGLINLLGPRTTARAAGIDRTGPTISRHQSEQSVGTPWEFIHAVEAKFGPLSWDLAADAQNTKAPCYISEETNSFQVPWHQLSPFGLNWLNPPFSDITPWARKCAVEAQLGAEILLLVPASVGADWYWDWVEPYADVYSVGRIAFIGSHATYGPRHSRAGQLKCKSAECEGCSPYPKDLILAHYHQLHPSGPQRIQRWRWKEVL